MYIFLTAFTLLGFLILARYAIIRRELSEKERGIYADLFVFIEDDGEPRTLLPNEVSHLNSVFHRADGGRPYIKSKYSSLTPDGRIGGYLLKRKLPSHIAQLLRDS